MKNLFDFNAQASQNLYGGQSATRAVGLPTQPGLPGSFAPGGSNATGQALLQQMQERTQQMRQAVQRPPTPTQARVGYNPATKEFFSNGRVFKADLNEGRQAAAAGFFDVDNEELPEGFQPVFGESAKAKLQKDFESQDIIDDFQRRTGQFLSGAGSTMRDLGAERAGGYLENVGGGLAARNPSQISTGGDILDKPLTAAGEAIGEAGFDLLRVGAGAAAGAKAGTAIGTALAPVTAGASIPLGTILGSAAGIFLPTLFEIYGSVRAEQRESGQEDRGRALAAATGSAALESVLGPEAAIGRLVTRKVGPMAARELLEKGAAKSIAQKALIGGVVEGPMTEVPQSAIERWGAFQQLTGEDALNEYIIGGFKGFVGGGAMTTVTASVEYAAAKTFANNFLNDQRTATDITKPSSERLAAARRVQDVLRGASDDPQFNQQLGEFRQLLARLDYMVTQEATREALENKTSLNLLQPRRAYESPEGPFMSVDAPNSIAATVAAEADAEARPARPPIASPIGFQGPPVDIPTRLNALLDEFNDWSALPQGPDTTLGGFEARPVQPAVGPVTPFTGDPTTLGGFEGAPAPVPLTPTQQNIQSVLDQVPSLDLGAPAAPTTTPTPAAEPLVQVETKPSPPAPSPAGVSPPAAAAAGALSTTKPTKEDSARLQTLIDRVDNGQLEASVESPAGMRVPGKSSLNAGQLAQVRDALLSPEGTVSNIDPKAQRLADAARAVAKAYYKYLNAGGNALRGIPTERAGKPTKFAGLTPAQQRGQIKQKTGKQADTAAEYLAKLTAAMQELGKAANNNAKDVEVVVKLVKDMVQQQAAKDAQNASLMEDYETDSMTTALKKLDAMLSQVWAAAKYGMFTEGTDNKNVRQQPLRDSREVAAEGGMGPIERAAQGYSTFGSEETYTGLSGVLTYLRTHGTPFERMLAKATRDVLYSSDREPKLVFIDSGNPRYDPNTNTVYINRNESPAVILHEALHAALQWYVINNPNAEAVKNLRASLKQVINYKGDLPAKAKAVQDLLKKLVKQGNELDAVLELISYGNTLNDFRKALDKMPGKGVPKTFFEAANNVWQNILTLVQKVLGVKPTVADDVIANTFKLLEAAGTVPAKDAKAMTKKGGNILEAAITMDGMAPMPEDTPTLLQRPGAALPTGIEVDRFNKKVLPRWLSTEVIFRLFGWPKVASATQDGLGKVGQYIRENFPGMERWTSYVNSRFGVPVPARGYFEQYKDDKQAGYKLTELLSTYIENQPADKVRALFAYLDGDKQALADDPATREVADLVKQWKDYYVSGLRNEKARQLFTGRKFSESMLFPGKAEQIASQTFGARQLNQMIGQKTQFEAELGSQWLMLDSQGDPDLDSKNTYYEVYTENADGSRVHQGFIDSRVLERDGPPAGFKVDPGYVWYHTAKNKQGHKFVANMTAAQAINENKALELANALRNTMAALANNFASQQFATSIANYGRTEATKGLTPVAYDKVSDIPGKVDPRTVLPISAAAAASPRMQHKFRSSHLWVQIPNTDTYGDLKGKVVSASVWSAMNDMSDRRPAVNLRVFNDSMRWFKKAKTIYNPGTHVTNVATNFSLAMLHDIPMATVAKAAKLFAVYEVAPNRLTEQERQLVLAFMNSNALLGDFSSAEVKQALYDAWLKSIDGTENTIIGRLATLAKVEKAKAQKMNDLVNSKADLVSRKANRADQIATQIYAAEDNVFRLAAFMKRAADLSAQNGGTLTAADLQNAGDFARSAFLDYDIDSKAVRLLRQTFLPFISWPYAILPVLGRIALHQPWKIANLLLGYYLLQAALSGEDDEELRKKGPEWARERMFGIGPYMHVRIPFMGDDQNPVWYKLGSYIPMADSVRGLPLGVAGLTHWPGALTPSGPFFAAVITGLTGRDPFTGKELAPPTSTDWEKFGAFARYMGGQFLPVPAADALYGPKWENVIKGRTDQSDNYAALQMARWAGLKLHDYNVPQAMANQSRAQMAIMAQFREELGRMQRAEARFENPDWDGFRKKQAELVKRMQQEMAKARGEE